MNVFEAIETRRSTRAFSTKVVEREKVEQVVEAGRWAPCGSNSQKTHFMVIQNPDVLAKLAELVQKEYAKLEATPGMYKSKATMITLAKAGKFTFHYNAPVVTILANERGYTNELADTMVAAENMLLMANELDLGSCFINAVAWLNESPVIREYLESLGLKKEENITGTVAFGYANTPDNKPIRTLRPITGNPVTYID